MASGCGIFVFLRHEIRETKHIRFRACAHHSGRHLLGQHGHFVRRLGTYGFSPIQIVCIRVVLAAVVFCVIQLVKDPKGFRISLRDIPLFLGLGLGSILFFTVCYFTAISMMTLSTAAILLYTSPIWIIWTFIIAGIGSILISHPADIVAKFAAAPSLPGLLGLSLLTALVTAVIPFLAYTLGLRHVEASKAGILATVEPMVATLIGIFVFSEPLTLMSGLGVLLILTAVVILNVFKK